MRLCKHCGTEQMDDQFGKHPWCRSCKAEGLRRWRAQNRERENAKARERYARDRERLTAESRKRYAANPEPQRQRNRHRYAADPSTKRAQNRAWRDANRERAYAISAAWAEANADRVRFLHRRSNGNRRAAVASVAVIPFTAEQLTQRMSMFAGCWMCGGTWTEVDHVKPIAKGGAHALCNLRPACKPCNSGKKDRWPHDDYRRTGRLASRAP